MNLTNINFLPVIFFFDMCFALESFVLITRVQAFYMFALFNLFRFFILSVIALHLLSRSDRFIVVISTSKPVRIYHNLHKPSPLHTQASFFVFGQLLYWRTGSIHQLPKRCITAHHDSERKPILPKFKHSLLRITGFFKRPIVD